MFGNSRQWILLAAFFAAVIVGVVGCSFLGGRDGSISTITSVGEQTPVTPVPLADQVSFQIVLPDRAPNTSIRMNGVASPTVTFTLTLLNPLMVPESSIPTIVMRKIVPVLDGKAEAIFSSVPANPVIGEIEIANGTIGGFASFHGAQDLGVGSNTVVLAPKGSKLQEDVIAEVLRRVLADQTSHSSIMFGMVRRLSASLVGLGLEGDGVYTQALARFLQFQEPAPVAVTTSQAQLTVATQGGTLTLPNSDLGLGEVRLSLASGSLAASAQVTITRLGDNTIEERGFEGDSSLIRCSPVFEFDSASDMVLGVSGNPATLTLPIDSALADRFSADEIVPVTYQNGVWQEVPGATIDLVNRQVTFGVRHFSPYSIIVKRHFEFSYSPGKLSNIQGKLRLRLFPIIKSNKLPLSLLGNPWYGGTKTREVVHLVRLYKKTVQGNQLVLERQFHRAILVNPNVAKSRISLGKNPGASFHFGRPAGRFCTSSEDAFISQNVNESIFARRYQIVVDYAESGNLIENGAIQWANIPSGDVMLSPEMLVSADNYALDDDIVDLGTLDAQAQYFLRVEGVCFSATGNKTATWTSEETAFRTGELQIEGGTVNQTRILQRIEVVPAKVVTLPGKVIDLGSLDVTAVFSDASTQMVTVDTWTKNSGEGTLLQQSFTAPNVSGTTVLRCSVTLGGITRTADMTVVVVPASDAFSLRVNPEKMVIPAESVIDLAASVAVEFVNSGGNATPLTAHNWSQIRGAGYLDAGKFHAPAFADTVEFTCSYASESFSASANLIIEVVPPTRSPVSLTLNPASDTYRTPWDPYSFDRITVAVRYDDGSEKQVKNVFWSVKSGTTSPIDNNMIWLPDLLVGSYTFTCRYSENGVSCASDLPVTLKVVPNTLSIDPASLFLPLGAGQHVLWRLNNSTVTSMLKVWLAVNTEDGEKVLLKDVSNVRPNWRVKAGSGTIDNAINPVDQTPFESIYYNPRSTYGVDVLTCSYLYDGVTYSSDLTVTVAPNESDLWLASITVPVSGSVDLRMVPLVDKEAPAMSNQFKNETREARWSVKSGNGEVVEGTPWFFRAPETSGNTVLLCEYYDGLATHSRELQIETADKLVSSLSASTTSLDVPMSFGGIIFGADIRTVKVAARFNDGSVGNIVSGEWIFSGGGTLTANATSPWVYTAPAMSATPPATNLTYSFGGKTVTLPIRFMVW